MSVYSLTTASEKAIGMLLTAGGGSETLLLRRPECERRIELHIEAADTFIEAVISAGAAQHSIKLPSGDSANGQHLADFIEAIANGTADTAEQAPVKVGPFDHLVLAEAAAANQQPTTADMVNHPPHYTGHPSGVECIEVAEHLPFCLGNAFKYLFRRDQKDQTLENVNKAIWYLERHTTSWPEIDWSLPSDVRDLLGSVAAREPHPFGGVMLIIGAPSQCGGYDAAICMLREEAERLSRGAEPRRAA
ncbi:MAG: DUF3310 domain-containing protein [Ectopseudomonas guguanensis]|uniref:DUF3310 domain-containing protein n=1 Tax=Ectopseudomonas guguanensis TaxID=1198456 RepID=UPI00391BE46D